jgi:hypothetical protein
MLARNPRFAGDVTGAISKTMTDYALGLSFVMAIMAGMTTVALMLLKVSYYYILGPLAGIAIMLPYVGVILSTVPAITVAFFQYDGQKALVVLIVYLLLQFTEGNILTPLIVGGRVRLFPLTVMVAFIFWGLIWGIAGAVLAVPLTSAIKVICENVRGLEGVARLLGEPDLSTADADRDHAADEAGGAPQRRDQQDRSPVEKRRPEDREDRVRRSGEERQRRAVRRVEQGDGQRASEKSLSRRVQPEWRAHGGLRRSHEPHDLDLLAVEVEREADRGRDGKNRRENEHSAEEQAGPADHPDRVGEAAPVIRLGFGRVDPRPGFRRVRDLLRRPGRGGWSSPDLDGRRERRLVEIGESRAEIRIRAPESRERSFAGHDAHLAQP